MTGIILTQGNWAHRLLQNQLVESTPLVQSNDGVTISNDWKYRSADEMGLMNGGFEQIRFQLMNANASVPKETMVIPKVEKPHDIQYENSTQPM